MSGGGGSQTIGYKYYLGMHMGLCHGPVDVVSEIQVDRRTAWEGSAGHQTIQINAPTLFGGDSREGGISGSVDIEMGYPDQTQNAYLQAQLGSDIPAFRGVACLVLNQCYMGNNPYLKPWAVKASRTQLTSDGSVQWYAAKASIDRGEDIVEPAIDSLVGTTFGDADLTDGNLFPLDTGAFTANIVSPFSMVDGVEEGVSPVIDSCVGASDYHYFIDNDAGTRGLTLVGSGLAWPISASILFANSPSDSNKTVARDFVGNSSPMTFMQATAWVARNGGATYVAAFSVRYYFVENDWGADGNPGPSDTPTVDLVVTIAGGFSENDASDPTRSQTSKSITLLSGIPMGDDLWTHWSQLTADFDEPLIEARQDANNPSNPATWNVMVRFRGSMTLHYNPTGDAGDVTIYTGLFDHERVVYGAGGVAQATAEGHSFTDTRPTSNYGGAHLLLPGGRAAIGYIKTNVDPDETYTRFLLDQSGSTCLNCVDMNPAHIIRECLTDNNWGMGYGSADIDDTAFTAAADTLFAEGMGISVLWDREQSIEDFVGEMLRHIDGVLYVSRSTGRFVLKLIRDDFGTIPALNEANVSSVTNASRPTISELTNAVSVVYWNPETDEDESLTLHNEALRQIQGVQISTTIQYPGFTNRGIASRVATRDLKSLSTPLLSCEIIANRSAADLNIGDPFTLDWPDLNISTLTMRVESVDYGDGIDNSIKISAIQDVFSTPSAAPVGIPSEVWVDPLSGTPEAAVARLAIEAPYYSLVVERSELTINNVLEDDNGAGFLLASGGRVGSELNAALMVDAGGGYVEQSTVDFHPYAYLTADINQTATKVYYDGGIDLDLVSDGSLAQIGDELIRFDSFGSDGSGDFINIGRGVLDTVPASHADNDFVVFWGAFADSDEVQYTDGESIDVKLQTVESGSILDIADAPADALAFDARAYRPYPPGDFQIDATSYPSSLTLGSSHVLTWAHRDRLQQTSGSLFDHTEGDIGPEAGTTYLVKGVEVASGVETEFLSTNVGGVKTYTWGGTEPQPSGSAEAVIFKVFAVRDSYHSLQAPSVTLAGPAVAATDPDFANVSLLLPFDGVNGATATTDLSSTPKAVTFVGDSQLDTSEKKYGTASLLFDGTGDHLEINALDLIDIEDSFTFESWVRFDTATRGMIMASNATTSVVWAGSNLEWLIQRDASGQLSFQFRTGAASPTEYTGGTIATGVWQHVAVSSDATTVKGFIGGVQVFSGSITGAVSSGSANNHQIGQLWSLNLNLDGRIDDLRTTKGVARYTAAFTPPAIAHPTS